MRPLGDVALALLDAAREAPGPVLQLAHRAQVGYSVARYTASRMVDRGDLVVVQPGRPAVLGVAPAQVPAGDDMGDALDELHRSFWHAQALPERDDLSEFAAL
jgi:hypothetical protein